MRLTSPKPFWHITQGGNHIDEECTGGDKLGELVGSLVDQGDIWIYWILDGNSIRDAEYE